MIAAIAVASVPEVLAVWAYVLESASEHTPRGSVGEINPRLVEASVGVPHETAKAIFEAMAGVVVDADGTISGWKKRQYDDTTVAERKRLQRARDKEMSRDVTEKSQDVTKSHGCVTHPDTDSDSDSEQSESNVLTRDASGEEEFVASLSDPLPEGPRKDGPYAKAMAQAPDIYRKVRGAFRHKTDERSEKSDIDIVGTAIMKHGAKTVTGAVTWMMAQDVQEIPWLNQLMPLVKEYLEARKRRERVTSRQPDECEVES